MTVTIEHPDTLRRTGAAVLALGASELIGKVATLATFLVMARMLAVAEFGVMSFGLSLGLLLAVLPSLGLDARLTQLASARPELLDRCYGALVAGRVIVSAAVMVPTTVLLFLTEDPERAVTVAVLVASGLVDTFTDASRAACGVLRRQHLAALVLVVQRFSALVLTAVPLVLTGDPALVALGYLAGTCIGVLGMHLAARRAGARLVMRGSRAEARVLLAAAHITGPGAVAEMGVFRIDSAIVGVMLGTAAVGVYGAGYRIFESILFVSWTLSRAYVPVIARRPDDPAHVRTWARRAMVVVCAVYLPYGVVVALRGDDLVALLFGPEYVDRGVLLGLAAAPLLFGLTNLGANVLLALRPDPVVLVASVAGLVVNVGLNLWLIPRYGITAAAATTALAFLVQAVILIRAVTGVAGSIVSWPAMAAVVVASASAGAVVVLVGPLLAALGAAVLAFLLVWAGASHLLGAGDGRDLIAMLRGT